ncbi:MAG TPA: HD-GYP domain-containing protein [Trueperaceae bacterium]|nr:HD-GYP domain-containing protein [Trueperaceae bacterium]
MTRYLVTRRQRTAWNFSFQLVVVAVLLVLGWLLLVAVGASHFVFVHAMYVPVLLAAFWFRRVGALLTAVVAAFVAGPLLPWQAAPAVYAHDAWLIRGAFFVATGALAGHLSTLLDERHARLRGAYASITHLYARTLHGFMRLLELKDEETSAHCERVARNALTVGHALGFDRRRLETLYWAGYLHDVGKLATPANILLKPSSLTEAEYDIIKQHAAIGAELLVGVSPAFEEIAVGVRHHHERWDGRGYPDGLSQRDIPVFGRILSVVDVFEAMTSARPYRKAIPVEDARAILDGEAGTQLDPELVPLFLRLEAEGTIHVEGRDGRRTGMEAPDRFDPEMLTVGRRGAAPGIWV